MSWNGQNKMTCVGDEGNWFKKKNPKKPKGISLYTQLAMQLSKLNGPLRMLN